MITDEMLSIASAELYQALLDNLPAPEDCHHDFSSRFLRKMKRLIWKDAHPAASWIIQRVASILLVLFLSFAALLALSPSVRAELLGWIRETFGFYTHYSYQNSTSYQEDSDYCLGYIPEQYEEYSRTALRSKTEVHYLNPETQQLLHFVYCKNRDAVSLYLDSRNYTVSSVPELGSQAEYYQSLDNTSANSIFVYDEGRNTFFWISGHTDLEELILIYKNIEILKK